MGALKTLDDATIAAAGEREPAALRELYTTYSPAVCGFLRLRGADDPEGLTNDVFIGVLPKLNRLEGGERGFRTLLFSIAHARLIDARRRKARQLVAVTFNAEDDERLVASAEQVAVDNIGNNEALRALDVLTDDQRAVIVMRVLADLSIKDTAKALDKSEPAVKKLQAKALTVLRHHLDDRAFAQAV